MRQSQFMGIKRLFCIMARRIAKKDTAARYAKTSHITPSSSRAAIFYAHNQPQAPSPQPADAEQPHQPD